MHGVAWPEADPGFNQGKPKGGGGRCPARAKAQPKATTGEKDVSLSSSYTSLAKVPAASLVDAPHVHEHVRARLFLVNQHSDR